MEKEGDPVVLSVVEDVTTLNTSITHLYDTYEYNIHPHWKQFPPVSDSWHYFIGFFITCVGISGVVGNSVVIWVFTTTKTLKTPSNMLIINLALSDLTFSAVNGFPLMTVSAFSKRWVFGNAACEFYGLIGGIFGLMSINTLAMISVDRYICITKPLKAARLMTRKKAFIMIVIVWVWAAGWAILPLFGLGAYIPEGFQTSCTFDYLTKSISNRIHIIGMYVFAFAFPLLVIIGCYVQILKFLRKHNKKMANMAGKLNAEEADKREKSKSEIRITKIAMTLISLFILSWSPYATIALIAQFGSPHFVTPLMAELPVMLAKASAMHNPMVYALSHPKFREALMKKAPCFLSCCMPKDKTNTEDKPQPQKQPVHRNLSKTFSDASMSSIQTNLSDLNYEGNETKTPREQWDTTLDMVRQLVGAIVCMATKRNNSQTPNGISSIMTQEGDKCIDETLEQEMSVFTVNNKSSNLVALVDQLRDDAAGKDGPMKPSIETESVSCEDNPSFTDADEAEEPV